MRQVEAARFLTLVTSFEGGREQRRSKTELPRRWVLDFEKQTMTTQQAKEIREFFEARRGRYEPFEWDYVDDEGETETVVVRFDTDTLDRTEEYETVYRFRLPLVEVIDT